MTAESVQLPSAPLPAKLRAFAADIKIAHSVFALPWALLAVFIAARGWPRAGELGAILLCMVTARTVAMAANRLLDAKLDLANPRTARRAIPSGRLSAGFVLAILLACAVTFIASCSVFWFAYGNILPLIFSVPLLLFLCSYPLMKRFTSICHYYLGAALALAPVCGWIAMGGAPLAPTPWLMFAAVLCWTAGFDIIYACQDYESDVATGVFSVPAKCGIGGALWISRATHAIALAALIALAIVEPSLSALYIVGVIIAGVLLVIEQSLVRPRDLSKVGLAFFTINGIISIVVGALGIADVLRNHGGL